MRASPILLLAATCIASLVGEALADCAKATWGITSKDPGVWTEKANDVVVNVTNKSNVTVDIPPPSNPIVPCNMVGVVAEFCEARRLHFKHDLTVVAILDANSTASKALLSSVVYCTVTKNK